MKRKNIGRVAGVAVASLALGAMAQSALAAAPACGPGNDAQTIAAPIGTPLSIPDSDPSGRTSEFEVTGKTGVIRDVDVITRILHTYNRDLSIQISHTEPGGVAKTVQLINASTTNRNAKNGFSDTRWDDSGAKTVKEATKVPAPGIADLDVNGPVASLIPEGSLGAFVGDNPNGKWSLKVTDTAAVDTGTVEGWSIDLATSASPNAPSTNLVTGGPPAGVDDNQINTQVVTSSLAVSGQQGYLTDVNLKTSITHRDDPGELRIWLTSPAGTKVLISDGRGSGSLDSLTTTWDDSATDLITQAKWSSTNAGPNPRVRGSVVPEAALAAFIGENPNSDANGGKPWIVTIEDTNPPTADNPETPIDESKQYGFEMSGWSLQLTSAAGCNPAPSGGGNPPAPTPDPAPPVTPAPVVTPTLANTVALPAPVCVRVGLGTKVLGVTGIKKGKSGVVKVQLKNTGRAAASGAGATFAIPSGFTVTGKPKGATIKKGKITLPFGSIAAGKTKTVSLTLKAGAKASTGLRKRTVSAYAACGSKGSGKLAVTIKKA